MGLSVAWPPPPTLLTTDWPCLGRVTTTWSTLSKLSHLSPGLFLVRVSGIEYRVVSLLFLALYRALAISHLIYTCYVKLQFIDCDLLCFLCTFAIDLKWKLFHCNPNIPVIGLQCVDILKITWEYNVSCRPYALHVLHLTSGTLKLGTHHSTIKRKLVWTKTPVSCWLGSTFNWSLI